MKCMNQEIFDLSLSMPRRTLGRWPACQNGAAVAVIPSHKRLAGNVWAPKTP
jgi:hypothetical protein